jgi:acetoin utilization deacetylase AcuC-like enzyme
MRRGRPRSRFSTTRPAWPTATAPESAGRITAIRDHLKRCGLLDRLLQNRPGPCGREDLERVHAPSYIDRVEAACRRAPENLDPDTGVSAGSWEAALTAAGGAVAACDTVMGGLARTAFVACRPPGHHAEADRAMGFCLFNNVAVAARHLQQRHGLARVFIVDWDVHHGNGTQHAFEDDDTVFYFSTHQFPFYPGTGHRGERGRGRGIGYTLNMPLTAGAGDADYATLFRSVLLPAIDGFRPEFILISAGFDAHRDDPLAGMALSEAGYREMTAIVRQAADAHCGGRIVSVLEGGYDLKALASSVEAHLEALGSKVG